MTKLAALGPAFWASLALGAGASLIQHQGMKSVQKKNDAATRQWLDYQNRNKARFDEREKSARGEAVGAAAEDLRLQTQESREGIINDEAARLEAEYGAGLPAATEDALASAQAPGQSDLFDAEMAKGLAKATDEARSRIKALAKSSAYGGGTQFGMGQTLGDSYTDAATDIGFLNDQRRGDTNTLLRYQTVQPEVYEYKKPAIASLMEAGSMIVGGMDPASLSSLFGGGKMASSLIPKANPRLAAAAVGAAAPATFSFLPTYATPRFGPQ